ncbi:MAG: hypothetical protein SF066_03830 [Thermoanaerobaculia bacterium]|nr:hypothetical protein [Thermoanaerobaculia bacterium]
MALLISWERVYARDALLSARRRWLLARIGIESGYTPAAAALLAEVQHYFRAEGRALEATLAEETSLQLALVQGDRDAAAVAAGNLYLGACALGLGGEQLAAAGVLLELGGGSSPDVTLVRECAASLARTLRRRPALDISPNH